VQYEVRRDFKGKVDFRYCTLGPLSESPVSVRGYMYMYMTWFDRQNPPPKNPPKGILKDLEKEPKGPKGHHTLGANPSRPTPLLQVASLHFDRLCVRSETLWDA